MLDRAMEWAHAVNGAKHGKCVSRTLYVQLQLVLVLMYQLLTPKVLSVSPFHPFGFDFEIDYEQIRTHYRHGLITSPMDSYRISAELEYLSQLMWQAFRLYPHFNKFRRLSGCLKDMAIEVRSALVAGHTTRFPSRDFSLDRADLMCPTTRTTEGVAFGVDLVLLPE
jgi:hypothetical protein